MLSPMRRAGLTAALALCAVFCATRLPPARAVVAGDPNPPTDAAGHYLYPPDSPLTPYDPITKTGRLDQLGPGRRFPASASSIPARARSLTPPMS